MKWLVTYDSEEYVLYSIRENEEPILIHRSEIERMIKLYQKYDRFETAPDDEKVEFLQMVFTQETNVWTQGKYGGVIPVNRIRTEWLAFQWFKYLNPAYQENQSGKNGSQLFPWSSNPILYHPVLTSTQTMFSERSFLVRLVKQIEATFRGVLFYFFDCPALYS